MRGHRRLDRKRTRPLVPAWNTLAMAYEAWGLVRSSWLWWRLAFLAVLAVCVVFALRVDPEWAGAAIGWLLAGSAAWVAGVLTERDAVQRAWRHETSDLPAVGGWRLTRPVADLPGDELLLLDLLLTLHDEARLVRRPIRGHRSAGERTTYAIGLRDLAREWARNRGIPVRRADALMHVLVARSVVLRVRINMGSGYRLADRSGADALRRLESSGSPLVAWHLGRDPRHDGWFADGRAREVRHPHAMAAADGESQQRVFPQTDRHETMGA